MSSESHLGYQQPLGTSGGWMGFSPTTAIPAATRLVWFWRFPADETGVSVFPAVVNYIYFPELR